MTTLFCSNARKEKLSWSFRDARTNKPGSLVVVSADQNAHTYTPAAIQRFVSSCVYAVGNATEASTC